MLVIISFILMILRNDSAVLLKGEIRCWSLLGFKGLIKEFAGFLITYYLFIYLFIYSLHCMYLCVDDGKSCTVLQVCSQTILQGN